MKSTVLMEYEDCSVKHPLSFTRAKNILLITKTKCAEILSEK